MDEFWYTFINFALSYQLVRGLFICMLQGSISVSDLSHGHRLTYTGALRENTVAPKASTR